MTQKTPLELTEEIIRDDKYLLELGPICQSLLFVESIEDKAVRSEIVKALGHRVGMLAGRASNIYWNAAGLKKALTAELEAEMQIKDGDELTENDLDFLDEEEGK